MAGAPVPLGGAGVVGNDGATKGVQPCADGAGEVLGTPVVIAGGAGQPGTVGAPGATVAGDVVHVAPGMTGEPRGGPLGDVTGAVG